MRVLVVVALACGALAGRAQHAEGLPADTTLLRFVRGDSALRLPHRFIQRDGFRATLGDSTPLRASALDIDFARGFVRIADTSLFPADTLHPFLVRLAYSYVPLMLQQDTFVHRRLVVIEDSTGARSLAVKTKPLPLSSDNLFGAGFQRNGTLIRGFTAGNQQDVVLSSGFQLQFSGRVAGDVDVIGALSDNNTPIQPEGNTQTLQELDKVFITLKAPSVSGTLGDFNTTIGNTELAGVSRKVEGGEAAAHSDAGSAFVVAATTRGKYRSATLAGIDGVQGPYRLLGENGENAIIVVAGTEHVFIDGIAQSRGENLDYTIDYSTAEITFSPRRIISAASRIAVDYQYSDRKYSRSLIAAQTSLNAIDTTVRFTATYVREADNQDAPLDIALSDSDKAQLARAGGERTKASRSGVVDVGVDSITARGKGLYVRRDTVIGGKSDTIYLYAPGDSLARYVVSFSYVGAGAGSYARVAGQEFRFVGAGSGDYDPTVYLAMPKLSQMIDGRLTASLGRDVTTGVEMALSDVSLNRFSTLADAHRSGVAGVLSLGVAPQRIAGGAMVEGGLRVRTLAPSFESIDRIDDVEFARQWNLPATSDRQQQTVVDGHLMLTPVRGVSLAANLGVLRLGGFSTIRQQYTATASSLYDFGAEYHAEVLQSSGQPGVTSSQWVRQSGDAKYAAGAFVPGFHVDAEVRNDHAHLMDSTVLLRDTLAPTSYRSLQWGPRLQVAAARGVTLFGEYVLRTQDSVLLGALHRQSAASMVRFTFDLQSVGGVSSSGEFSVRNQTPDSAFATASPSSRSVVFRLQGAARPLNGAMNVDVFYSAASQRAAKLERVFVLVPYGTGQYIYLGDLNHNGIADEAEYSLTNGNDGTYALLYRPTDALFPIIDLKSSARLRLRPAVLFSASQDAVARVIGALSGESSVRIEERSTTPTPGDVYALRLGRFQDDRYTLSGTKLFQQDVFVLENDPEFSLRARYSERRALTSLATTSERSYQREQSLRVRWHLVSELTSELTGGLTRDDLAASAESVNTPRRLETSMFVSDLSYRPWGDVEFGWKADVRTTRDANASPAVTANKSYQTVRVVYAFSGSGRIRGELERDGVTLGARPSGYVNSFQLTDGFAAGATYIARGSFEYRVTANIQASATYTGRLRDASLPVHTFQAEVRAMF